MDERTRASRDASGPPERAGASRLGPAATPAERSFEDAQAAPARLGDFRLGRRLGGGGMGVVYAAVQESLGREVALKVVRPDQLFVPGARERFRREVRLVARLSHPGIVPVYTVGEDESTPYFAMELVEGVTLAEVLATLGAPATRGRDLAVAVSRVAGIQVRGALYEGDGVTACVRIARGVAEALAHAHERGVLHRDVKPSNVMLTTDGRALLFDFGLARSHDSATITGTGARVGSLAYMAPEQVRGGAVDERCDVYGLGALLCEALTLAPPHGGDPDAIVAALLDGESPDVRRRRPDLPRDVVTVVHKALAPEPRDRYACATDLARDLGHVLARRPVEARRLAAGVRLVRRMRRRPARAAAVVLAIAAFLALLGQQLLTSHRIGAQSERADANLDHALAVLDGVVWGLGLGVLEHVPHVDAERLALLRDAVASVDELAARDPGDVDLGERTVRMHAALGGVLAEMGRLAEARACFRTALDRGRSANVRAVALVPALNGLGIVHERGGRVEEALEAYEAARAALSTASGARLEASAVLRNVSRLQRWTGRGASDASAEAAVGAAERALRDAASDEERFEASFALAAALNERAVPETVAGGGRGAPVTSGPAHDAYARALARLLELADERPQRTDVVYEAAAACVNAHAYLPAGEAAAVIERGLGLLEPLRRDFPERVDYARTHAQLATNLGWSLASRGRPDEALPWFEAALETAEADLARDDEDVRSLLAIGRANVNVAMSLVELGRRAEACEPAARGAGWLERVLEIAPDHPVATHDLAWARVQEGYGGLARGERERARRLAETIPVETLDDPTLTVAVGELLAGCADLAEDPDEARRLREGALDHLARGLALGFTRRDYLRTAAEWASLRGHERFEALVGDVADAVD